MKKQQHYDKMCQVWLKLGGICNECTNYTTYTSHTSSQCVGHARERSWAQIITT